MRSQRLRQVRELERSVLLRVHRSGGLIHHLLSCAAIGDRDRSLRRVYVLAFAYALAFLEALVAIVTGSNHAVLCEFSRLDGGIDAANSSELSRQHGSSVAIQRCL